MPRIFCSCYTFLHVPAGGVRISGAAEVSQEVLGGGCHAGGTADVGLTGDPWEDFYAVWPLDESAPGTYADHSRHGQEGEGLTQVVDGLCQEAQGFGGQFEGEEVIMLPDDGLIPSQAFSVSAWVKIDNRYTVGTIYARGYATTTELPVFWLQVGYLGYLICGLTGASGEAYEVSSSAQLTENRWYHVGASWTPGDALRIYFDGIQVGHVLTPETSTASLANSPAIGCLFDGSARLSGSLQEVRLHGQARDSDWFSAERANVCSASFYSVGEVSLT